MDEMREAQRAIEEHERNRRLDMACICPWYSEDMGGGVVAYVPEYDPACPTHSVHRWDPATSTYVLKEDPSV